MRKICIFLTAFYSLITIAEQPYPIIGKRFFVVNLTAKTCNEIFFKNDLSFQLQVSEKDLVGGKYSYNGGILKLINADGIENSKLLFQKIQEVDGKLAIILKDLNANGNVNIYANKNFCETTGFKMKNLKQEMPRQVVSAHNKGSWIYTYISTISGDKLKKETSKQCLGVAGSTFDVWWHEKKAEMSEKHFTCIEPGKSPSGEYFANNLGCNLSKTQSGKIISMALAIRTPGAVVSTYLGRWFVDKNECEKARSTEVLN